MTPPERSPTIDPPPAASHVLLVDHDRDDRQVLATALIRARFLVAEADDGLQAFRKALDDPPSVVVTGVMIPGIDGLELCRRLRRTASTSGIPIITVADAGTFLDDCERAEQAGADAVLVKPCHPYMLIAEIHRLLARAKELSLKAREAVDEAKATTERVRRTRASTRVSRDHLRRLRERTSVLRRLRTDFLELPGLRMTPQDGARLWNLDVDTCVRLLDGLVEDKFLIRTREGRYKRA